MVAEQEGSDDNSYLFAGEPFLTTLGARGFMRGLRDARGARDLVGLALRPDLVHRGLFEFYEIKPHNVLGIAEGEAQLLLYWQAYRFWDEFGAWHPGTEYQPPAQVGQGVLSAFVYKLNPGLITYCPYVLTAVAAMVATTNMVKIPILTANVGIATVNSML